MSVHLRLLFRSLLEAVVDSFVLVHRPTCGKLTEGKQQPQRYTLLDYTLASTPTLEGKPFIDHRYRIHLNKLLTSKAIIFKSIFKALTCLNRAIWLFETVSSRVIAVYSNIQLLLPRKFAVAK